jgi:membrane glycosyltransferase
VIGAVVIVLVLLLLMPFLLFMTGAVVAAILGWALKSDAEQRHEGSELVDLNN